MVKSFAFLAALAVSLVAVDLAEAGRRHCKSCSTCPGGVCYVEPSKTAAVTTDAPPVATAPAASAPVASAPVAAPQYSTARRGLFGWRR
ncbi:MAG: hypothetical protein SFU86_15470 [Pirellulaceae bacterium]|nr:hypothetical protein [Pirellulaceae bacterium]